MERRGTIRGGFNFSMNAAKIDASKLAQYPLPGDLLADLQDAFQFYDKEDSGYISMAHFRNILHNFGFHKMAKKEIDDELKRADPQFLQRQAVDFDTVKFVIGYRWNKGGKDEEAREVFRLFDKRERNYITPADLKQVLSNYLEFPVSEQDVSDFMGECDPQGVGQVGYRDFMKLYLS